ncbi:MAG: hypothetical protein K5685_06870 [Bacteroidales bacterium]|nr:hypothetical protein [Bacteroidales bacterium]
MMEKLIILLIVLGGYVNAQPFKGRVKNVNQFADYKIKIVNTNEDFLIKIVNHTPFNNYEWQFVDCFEDFSVQFVETLEDYKVKFEYQYPQNYIQYQNESAQTESKLNDNNNSYIFSVVGSEPRVLNPPFFFDNPNWKPDSIEIRFKQQWHIKDSMKQHKKDSLRRRDSIIRHYFWPEDF